MGAAGRRLDSTILAMFPGVGRGVATDSGTTVGMVDGAVALSMAELKRDCRAAAVVDADVVVAVVVVPVPVVVAVPKADAGTSTLLSPICTTKNCLFSATAP